MTRDRLLQIADAVERTRMRADRADMASELRTFADRLEAERLADKAQAAEEAAGYDYGRNRRSPAEG